MLFQPALKPYLPCSSDIFELRYDHLQVAVARPYGPDSHSAPPQSFTSLVHDGSFELQCLHSLSVSEM